MNPPFQRAIEGIAQTTVGPPAGLAYLAGAVRARGFTVTILDANALGLDEGRTVEHILRSGSDVVGFTATTATIETCGALAAALRAHGHRGRLLAGGPHPSALPERTLREHPALDVVAIDEAEETLPELLEAFAGERPLATVDGVAFRSHGAIRVTARRRVPDLDGLPPAAWDLLPTHLYRSPDGPAVTIVASRGCPAPCSYCAVPMRFGKKLRRRDPARVAEEIDGLQRATGIGWVNFIDDTFTWDVGWVQRLCDALHARDLPGRVAWQCLTRVDRVSPALFERMRAAGCRRIEMGIECASERGLAVLEKGITREQTLQAFRWARAAGLETLAFAMLNVPGETLSDIDATAALLREADPDWLQLTYCTPYPGTKLWDTARATGRLRTEDFREFRFLRRAVLDNGVLTEDEVRRAHRRVLRAFWLRPVAAARVARHLLRDPRAHLHTALTAARQARLLFTPSRPRTTTDHA